MIYRVLLALKDTSLVKNLVQEMHDRSLPCHVGAYRTAAALINDGSFDYADAVLMDASLLGSGMLMESLVHSALGRRMAVIGQTADEHMARVLASSGVLCQPETGNAEDLCDILEALLIAGRQAMRQDAVCMLLDSLPISITLKGGKYIEMALRLALHTPALMDRMNDDLYGRVAERCGVSVSSVERDIRYAIAQCWNQMDARQKRALLSRCTSRPAPKLFLAHMLRRLSREEYPMGYPNGLPLNSALYRTPRSAHLGDDGGAGC